VPSNDETKMKLLVASAKKIVLIDEKAMPLMVLVALVVGGTTDDWTYLAVYLVLVIVICVNTSETLERNTIATSTKEAAASDDGTRAAIGVGGLETTRCAWGVGASSREEKSNKLHQSIQMREVNNGSNHSREEDGALV